MRNWNCPYDEPLTPLIVPLIQFEIRQLDLQIVFSAKRVSSCLEMTSLRFLVSKTIEIFVVYRLRRLFSRFSFGFSL